jgi:hypothetical protein
MGVGGEEMLHGIKTIDTFDDVIPFGLTSPYVDTLTNVARNYGLRDMRDVLADYIELGKHTTLNEVKDHEGRLISYRPEIKVNINFANAIEIQRQLTATIILAEAVYFNNKFKIS